MIKRILLAAISAILMIAAFPPFSQGWTAWLGYVPLFFALEGLSKKKAFAVGYSFGLLFFLGTVYWVVHSMYYFGGVPFAASTAVMLMLVAYLSLYGGAFGLLFTVTGGAGGIIKIILIPAIWVSLEYIRGYLFTGLPWVVTGYTQAGYLPVIQIADNTGVWGISFIVLAVNVAVYLNLRYIIKREGDVPLRESAAAFVILVSAVVYGFISIKAIDGAAASWKTLKVAVAQGSINQGLKWDASYQKETLEIYRELSVEAGKSGAELIVWPETAIPFYFNMEKVRNGGLGHILKEAGADILTGSPSYSYNREAQKTDYFNSAFLLSPSGEVLGKYDKVHLVPFGEYVPLRSILPVEKLTAGIGDFTSGKGPEPIRFGGGGIGVLVCYESIFPEIARKEVKNGATILANLTNDAWFGFTSAPYQHFQMSVLRAVENKSYLIRAANTGISAVIDPAGRVRKTTPLFERALLMDTVGLRQGSITFYSRFGDVFTYGCLAISGLFITFGIKRRG